MKKSIQNILIIVLAVCAVVFAALGLSACTDDKVKFESIRIENARTEFKVGDEFECGEDFKVYAHYSDGSETDVTAEIQLKKEAGFDMNEAGNYQITVSWGGKKEIYTIYVGDFENILRKIELNTASVKTTYNLGDSVNLEGLKIKCTYENAQGNYVYTETTSLKDFNVEIVNEKNQPVKDVFDKLGTYTVTVSFVNVKASFTVEVSGVDISTVQGALAVGNAFKEYVVSGSSNIYNQLAESAEVSSEHLAYRYDYSFGINYTYIQEHVESPGSEFHYGIEDSEIYCVHLQNGVMVPNLAVQSGMIYGSPFQLWYSRTTEFGIENALLNLYNAAKVCTNKDLVENADESEREYSFSFSGLVFNSNMYDYYETEVSFTLGEDYSVNHAEFTQKYYENNDSLAGNGVAHKFTTDSNGYTTPTVANEYTMRTRAVVNQQSGERTLTNPYSRDSLTVKSYDLVYNGNTLGDDGVIECSMANKKLTLKIQNLTPSTALFEQDPMYFDYEGNFGSEVDSTTFLDCTGFFAFRDGNDISVTLRNGGVWTLKIRTSGTYKTVTFKVTGVAPTNISSQIGNNSTGKFYSASQKTVSIGGTVYFRGEVNQYANEAQTAQVTSSNASFATIEETTIGGVKCFKFTATKEGQYTVRVSSAVASSVRCTLTFTVNDVPDYAEILQGKYTVTDNAGNIFVVDFTPANTGEEVKGTVVVSRTPTTESGEVETDKKKEQTLNYNVDFENFSIVLTHASGENLGVELLVNEENKLVLEDQYGTKYKLNPET